MQVSFSIQIDPRIEQLIRKGGELATRKMQDQFLTDTANRTKNIMQKEAPVRTGRLRSGIKITKKEKKGGGLDRRANIRVESTVPYSRYVVAGARPSIGDGSPGTGRYIGPGGFGFRATKGFKGKRGFRTGFGFWPGYPPNDFISRAEVKIRSMVTKETKFIGINAYTESYNKLGIKFG